jgi:PAS domain S-box-containing protein
MKSIPHRSSTAPVFPREIKLLLDRMSGSSYIVDAKNRIVYSSPSGENMHGWNPGTLEGHALAETTLFPQSFADMIIELLRKGESWEGRSERIMPDGTVRTVWARWNSFVPDTGETFFVGVEDDITERIVREQEFDQARKLAKIGVLSESIAHELRNPLSYALSAAQLLEDPRLEKDVRLKCIQTITTGLRRAGLIVDNLLSLGKPQAVFTRTRVDLGAVVTEALDAAASHASFRRVRVGRHFPTAPLCVCGNHGMLVQVFNNVITNALNEMQDGGSIQIQGDEEGQHVRIRITDSGPGVSEEQIRHLFDPFYTASSTGRGTGLGLTLSSYIMKEHDGNIEVESVLGHGATFILIFPLPSEC